MELAGAAAGMEQATKPPKQIDPAATGDQDLTGSALGDYQILRRLGQGGMGQVYLAEQISLRRKVALKLLKPELAANEKSLLRFKREAESVARATHANIVQVHAIGEVGGLHFMALEYVEGRNLREYLEKKGPPEVFLGMRIISQVAAALQRASELAIVHRDIKPENILLTRKGEVKVADFGLTRMLDDGAAQPTHLTQSGVSMGTPLYMSPEQVEGKADLDSRSDIYSLGVTAYHMFAGHPPFRGDSPFEVAVQHVQNEPQPLAEIRPDLPAELCAVIHKMMAKQPEERYQTGREIVREIGRLRDALVGVTAGVTAASLGLTASGQLETIGASGANLSGAAKARRGWWPLAIGSVVAALSVGLLIGWLWTPSTASNPILPPDEAGKASAGPSDQERILVKLAQQFAKLETKGSLASGLEHQTNLAVFYLKEKRWDDADKFFKSLEKESKIRPYEMLGKTGTAILLAFQDKHEESNKLFAKLVDLERLVPDKDKAEKRLITFHAVVRHSPALSEMVAKALSRNFVNSANAFPEALEKYRSPPTATLKGG
jgi:serine/threonine-protein kinase